jgi:alkanesulfonate monooxygenase SsuD/methylene tetrahydromethanopterin reductase-like flavin-dependent oxidoreductase (luciferase family)
MYNRQRTIIGTPDEVFKKITAFAKELDVNEVVAATFAERKEDRFKSYEWLAKIFSLNPETGSDLEAVLTATYSSQR